MVTSAVCGKFLGGEGGGGGRLWGVTQEMGGGGTEVMRCNTRDGGGGDIMLTYGLPNFKGAGGCPSLPPPPPLNAP